MVFYSYLLSLIANLNSNCDFGFEWRIGCLRFCTVGLFWFVGVVILHLNGNGKMLFHLQTKMETKAKGAGGKPLMPKLFD